MRSPKSKANPEVTDTPSGSDAQPASAESQAQPAAADSQAQPVPQITYRVAPKRRVRCKDSVLQSGADVTAEAVGGQETLDALVRGGSVVVRP